MPRYGVCPDCGQYIRLVGRVCANCLEQRRTVHFLATIPKYTVVDQASGEYQLVPLPPELHRVVMGIPPEIEPGDSYG